LKSPLESSILAVAQWRNFKFSPMQKTAECRPLRWRHPIRLRPRHQGGAHRNRAPAKIVRAPAKIAGLFVLKIEKDQMAILCSMEAGADG